MTLQVRNCPHCGADLPIVEDAFCADCGERLDELPSAPAPTSPARDDTSPAAQFASSGEAPDPSPVPPPFTASSTADNSDLSNAQPTGTPLPSSEPPTDTSAPLGMRIVGYIVFAVVMLAVTAILVIDSIPDGCYEPPQREHRRIVPGGY